MKVELGRANKLMAWELEDPVPQLLTAATEMFPEEEPKVTVIEVVPAPEVMDAPAGTVQL